MAQSNMRFLPTVLPHQRHKPARAALLHKQLTFALCDKVQFLFVFFPARRDAASAFGELLQKRFRDRGGGGGNRNYIVGTRLRPTEPASPLVTMPVCVRKTRK